MLKVQQRITWLSRIRPNVLTETTAELGFTLMLAIARRIVEAEKYVEAIHGKAGVLILVGKIYKFNYWNYGTGDIGKAFARRLQGFNIKYIL